MDINSGDTMLVYIEDKNNLAKVLSYLDLANISYTTNIKDNYKTVLITDISNKVINIIKDKKVILLTNFIEEKILKRKFLLPKIEHLKIITSIGQLKGKNNVCFIPTCLPKYNQKKEKYIYEKYHLVKNKKRIIILDIYLEHIKEIDELTDKYLNYEIIYVGYRSLKKQELNKMKNMNVVWIKYLSLEDYNDLCNISSMSIIFTANIKIEYIYMTILTHTELFLIEDNIHSNYFIPCRHYFSFHDVLGLIQKLNKFIEERTSSLNDNAYFYIENNTEKNYLQALKKYLN